ncbi:cysteine-rich receptor-like protein kinase 10 [Typha latifolia]|uniref:cysteine-rich receptor-like protein kinase 10 n=1 Tax=Typha latifolia TaxID=4733 RepID=UPI003C2E9546
MTSSSPVLLLLYFVHGLLLLLLTSPLKAHFKDPGLQYCVGVPEYVLPDNMFDNLLSTTINKALDTKDKHHTENIGSTFHVLAQCRLDVPRDRCSDCFNSSYAAIERDCTSAALRYDDTCLLRYGEQPFSLFDENENTTCAFYSRRAENGVIWTAHVTALMNSILTSVKEKGLGTCGGVGNSSEGHIYGMMDCIRDLSTSDCEKCLEDAVRQMLSDNNETTGGQALRLSCSIRYETYRFFNTSLVPMALLNGTDSNVPAPSPIPPFPPLSPPPVASTSAHGIIRATKGKADKKRKTVTISVPVVATLVLLAATCICLQRRKALRDMHPNPDDEQIASMESLLFSLATLKSATDDFSDANKLGEGGFGPVYKGILQNGQEIAVKRLSRRSKQGLEELKNEVFLVAKLQNRNLVRLMGCCLEQQEKLLVYEYVPNKSLDKILFDPVQQEQLDWGIRYKIIERIGRAVLYLHEDSRLRIIHRDLKASNILLDENMNPKVSDFGLAKLSDLDKSHGCTNRIAGTRGYIAPEYARSGLFSTSSYVFSYGVLILEIVTGRRNNGFQESELAADLLSYVWHHWNEGTPLLVVDQSLGGRYQEQEALSCIQVGLLCVQEDPAKRPTMAALILLLSSSEAIRLKPSVPGYLKWTYKNGEFNVTEGEELREQSNKSRLIIRPFSANNVSITEMEPR